MQRRWARHTTFSEYVVNPDGATGVFREIAMVPFGSLDDTVPTGRLAMSTDVIVVKRALCTARTYAMS